jgi:hypothetical protein
MYCKYKYLLEILYNIIDLTKLWGYSIIFFLRILATFIYIYIKIYKCTVWTHTYCKVHLVEGITTPDFLALFVISKDII